MPPDDPFAARNVLEEIYHEVRDSYNMVIGPFGTKPQTIGVFLFCLEHPKAQVVYSFPVNLYQVLPAAQAGGAPCCCLWRR